MEDFQEARTGRIERESRQAERPPLDYDESDDWWPTSGWRWNRAAIFPLEKREVRAEGSKSSEGPLDSPMKGASGSTAGDSPIATCGSNGLPEAAAEPSDTATTVAISRCSTLVAKLHWLDRATR